MNYELCRALFIYDKETGLFVWRENPNIRHKIKGNIAGTKLKTGYISISYLRRFYLGHRLAWLYEYGEFPKGKIDHINGIKDDNRIANLRLATNSQNQMNTRGKNCNPFKGVSYAKANKKWRARINKDGVSYWLGLYDSQIEASEAYKKKAEELFGDFAYHLSSNHM